MRISLALATLALAIVAASGLAPVASAECVYSANAEDCQGNCAVNFGFCASGATCVVNLGLCADGASCTVNLAPNHPTTSCDGACMVNLGPCGTEGTCTVNLDWCAGECVVNLSVCLGNCAVTGGPLGTEILDGTGCQAADCTVNFGNVCGGPCPSGSLLSIMAHRFLPTNPAAYAYVCAPAPGEHGIVYVCNVPSPCVRIG